MVTEGKYTKNFQSYLLTDLKYNQLVEFAILLRDFKNEISLLVNNNLLHYINISKFDFITEMRLKYPLRISSYFDSLLYTQVYTCYLNRFDAILKKITFKKRIFKEFQLYKRTTKKHKAGDLKKVIYKNESSPLSTCLTYLARYGNENILNYIHSNYNNVNEKKLKFYDNILRCCTKFGFNKLYQLALRKRERIFNRYKNSIHFESLTFSGKTNYFNNIVNYNKKLIFQNKRVYIYKRSFLKRFRYSC